MKYTFAAPLALAALLGLSIYARANANIRGERDYGAYLDMARSFAADGLAVDAAENYIKALEIFPSLELRMEIAAFYTASGSPGTAYGWCEDTARLYPGEAAPYEYLMEASFGMGDIAYCFEIYESAAKLRISSAVCEDIMSEIEYSYFLTGKYEDAAAFSGGYCAVMSGGRWGYIDETGARRLRFIYAKAGPFGQNGRAAVSDENGGEYYIDAQGNRRASPPESQAADAPAPIEVRDRQYEDARDFSHGLAAVKKDGKWGYIDMEGDMVIENVFSEAGDFSGGGCAPVKADGEWTLLRLYQYAGRKPGKAGIL
ncbi:MAG: WG repeat-containing protein [Oscillospiraceae bacterium]|jgi:tetratricopeptide (TPR) repeat protein|nr:WG repeat-containing protein [Oscillospiraceae bacterium]